MNVIASALAAVGAGSDAVIRAARRTAPRVRDAGAQRRPRRAGLIAAALMLLVYLAAIGDIAFSASGRWADSDVARFSADGLFRTRAPYLFEPVLEVHPGAHVAVFASPVNLLLGLVVAALVGANIALAVHGAQQAVACKRAGYGGLLGVLPALGIGMACCVPAFLLALGTGTAAAVLPVLLPLRAIFYPLTLILLLGTLLWSAAKVSAAQRIAAAQPL